MNRASAFALVVLVCSGAAEPKDLVGVFEDAVTSDPVIRQADANRLAAREARPQAWAAVLPQLNATAALTGDHNSGTQPFFGTNPNGTPFVVAAPATVDTTTRQWGVNLRQNVFSWSNWVALKAAAKEVAQAEATYQAAEQQLILRVSQAYFNVLAAEAGLEANQTSLEAISRQLDQANKRFEVGLIAITDVEDAKAARDTAAAAVIAAKRTLATSEDQLQEITGQKYDRLAKPGTDMPLRSPEPADQGRWVEISLQQNLSLISSRLSADIARDNVRAAFGGHLPTLDVVAGRSYQNQGVNESFAGQPFGYDTYFNERQLGLQFTLPLFSGGATQSKVRQTQYQWIAAKEAVVQSSRATERQARDAYLGVISGIARVQALRQAVESNHTAVRATEAGYDVGTRTSVDVLNARRLLVQAETDYANSRYDYIVSVLQLRLAAGNLDRAQLTEINNWLTVPAPTSPAVQTPETLAPTVPPPGGAPAAAPPEPAQLPPPPPPDGKP
ncbi:MAG TPA: TolC family outer membrane protein [Steroidobacteraceae bacterium]|jgi:outer membrane protein|nr:TolC family outer membrane protein [Steroidobacteraceae bacterium]